MIGASAARAMTKELKVWSREIRAAAERRAESEAARAEGEALGRFCDVMSAIGSSANENASVHARRSRDESTGLYEPTCDVDSEVVFAGLPAALDEPVLDAWSAFLLWFGAWEIPAGTVQERSHVHPVMTALLRFAIGTALLRVWYEEQHEQGIDSHHIIPDLSCTAWTDACLSTIGCLFSLELKKLVRIMASIFQSGNYGRRTISQRFHEALRRREDPSKIWTIVAGSDLMSIAFSRIRSGAPAPGGSYSGCKPCPTQVSRHLTLFGEAFEFTAESIANLVRETRAAPPEGFRALVRVVRGGEALARDQHHCLLGRISICGGDAPLILDERLGCGGTSDVYRSGVRAVKIPRHTSTKIVAQYEHEHAALEDLKRAGCDGVPQSLLGVWAGADRVAFAAKWPVLFLTPVGTPLVTIVSRTPSGARRRLVNFVMRGVVQVLQRCHGAGLVHCDVRPENIVLLADAAEPSRIVRVILADWGLCRRSGDDCRGIGQPLYAHEDVFCGRGVCPASPWVDLVSAAYTFVALLHGVCAGRAPWNLIEETTTNRSVWFSEHAGRDIVRAVDDFVSGIRGGDISEKYGALTRMCGEGVCAHPHAFVSLLM